MYVEHKFSANTKNTTCVAKSIFSKPNLPFIGLCILATILRLYHSTTQNIWYDEAYSIDLAQQSIRQIISAAQADIHPPLFYIVLKGWITLFGISAIALRSLSIILSSLVLVLTFKLVKSIAEKNSALTTIFFLTFSAHQIYYAQEIRMYTLVTALTLIAAIAYRKWIKSDFENNKILIGYWLAIVSAIYTHYFALLIFGALSLHFFFFIWSYNKSLTTPKSLKILKKWLGLQITVVLAFVPWLNTFVNQASRGQSWRTAITIREALWNQLVFLKELLLGYNGDIKDLERALFNWNSIISFQQIIMYLTVGPLVLILLTITLQQVLLEIKRRESEKYIFTFTMFFAPLLVATLVSLKQSMQLSRYLLLITPYFFTLLALGISSLNNRILQITTISLCALGMTLSTFQYYQTSSRDSDIRPVLETIKTKIKPNDLITIEPSYLNSYLSYYAHQLGLENAVQKQQNISEEQLNYIKLQPQFRRWWVVLDYRSTLFEQSTFDNTLKIKNIIEFPDKYPKLRLLEIEK